ncbi:uncharacterized protein LOC126298185 [Schistocerca gregaria]|uniref:uncharacterized protein LOC126298185 n=1 Tax=Schistocerca gregaria TaxID=7010 RepID=UPI00211E4BB2|nr:uncharacterized protein LOC126298185 [Schistocerca gregaria]
MARNKEGCPPLVSMLLTMSEDFVLMVVDRLTLWPEAFTTSNISVDTVATKLLADWFARYGIPQMITPDCGRKFEACLFGELLQICGCTYIREKATALKALPLILLRLRSSVKEDVGRPLAEFLFGEKVRLTADLLTDKPTILPSEKHSSVIDWNVKHEMVSIEWLIPSYVYAHKNGTSSARATNQDLQGLHRPWTTDHIFPPTDPPPIAPVITWAGRTVHQHYPNIPGPKIHSLDYPKPAGVAERF